MRASLVPTTRSRRRARRPRGSLVAVGPLASRFRAAYEQMSPERYGQLVAFLDRVYELVLLDLGAAGLFTIGALITVFFTGRSAVYSGNRQVLIGVAARAAPRLLPLIVVDEIGYSPLDPRPPT